MGNFQWTRLTLWSCTCTCTPTCMHTHMHMHMYMHTQTHAYAPTRMHPTSVRVSDMHVLMPYQTCRCMLTHTLQIQSANPKRTDEHQPARDDFATCRAIKKRPCDMTRQQQDVTVCDMSRQQQQNWRHVASSRRRADTCAIQFILLGCDRDIFSYLCCSLWCTCIVYTNVCVQTSITYTHLYVQAHIHMQ